MPRGGVGKYVVIGGNGDSIYRRLMVAAGRTDLAEDGRLQSNPGRVEHQEEIDEAIAQVIDNNNNNRVMGAGGGSSHDDHMPRAVRVVCTADGSNDCVVDEGDRRRRSSRGARQRTRARRSAACLLAASRRNPSGRFCTANRRHDP